MTTSYIEQLEREIDALKKELEEAHGAVHEAKLDDRKLNSSELMELIRTEEDNANLIKFINKVIDNKKRHEANYKEALIYAARLFIKKPTEYKNVIFSKILSALKTEDIPEFMIRAGLSEDSIPLTQVASFRAALNVRMRAKQLMESLPEWTLDDKQTAYAFMDKLGIRKPWISERVYSMEEIPEKEGMVIKPVDGAGSRGVYLVYDRDNIFDVKSSNTINSWKALKSSMKRDVETGWVKSDDWITEELIYENQGLKTPASDVKFYCFYGKVGLILEITRSPELKYCWWTVTGDRIRTGKYNNDLYKGKGTNQSEIQMAADISAIIPAPFVRIDFLRSENGLVFGEFTPKPGNYDEFDEATDKWLGDMFIEAQVRLEADFLQGKTFQVYKEFIADKDKR